MKTEKQKRRSRVRILAEKIVARLFTDGRGHRAARLVMDHDGTTDMCGWAELPATDYVEKILIQSRPKRKGR